MLVKIKLAGNTLLDIAKTTHVAPCQILVQNNVCSEDELLRLPEIVVDVQIKNMISSSV
ncbi:MAG: hypothetical protein FWC00_03590 [Firmicutes bacterium]|nr:hypothetical protein [Bacillota bacterium]